MYKLLIIEDDAAIAGAIAALAASWEMETHIVSDFRAVLTEYAAFSPHIVLVDISLPFFRGYHCVPSCGSSRTCRSCSFPPHRTG